MNSKKEIEKIIQCYKSAKKNPVFSMLLFSNKYKEAYFFKTGLSAILISISATMYLFITKQIYQWIYILLLICQFILGYLLESRLESICAKKYFPPLIQNAWKTKNKRFFIFKSILSQYTDINLDKFDILLRSGFQKYPNEKHTHLFSLLTSTAILSAIPACIQDKKQIIFWIPLSVIFYLTGFGFDTLSSFISKKQNQTYRCLQMLNQYVIEEKEKQCP